MIVSAHSTHALRRSERDREREREREIELLTSSALLSGRVRSEFPVYVIRYFKYIAMYVSIMA